MLFEREVEIDGVIYNVEYGVSADFHLGEKKTYDNPGEDSYVEVWDIQVLKIDGASFENYSSEVLEECKLKFDQPAFEEEFINHIEAVNERDEDYSYYDPDENI